MAWLLAPTALHLTDDRESFGLLIGVEEEAGYLAFETDELAPDEEKRVVISDQYAPHYEFNGKSLYLAGYRYAGNPVWAAPHGAGYIFTSVSQGKLIYMDDLREPYLRPLLEGEDEEDSEGDEWWEIPPMPQLRREYNCTAKGMARTEAGGEGDKNGKRVWNVWEPFEIENVAGVNDPWCGVYKNNDPDDGSYKSIGVPVFKYYSGPAAFAGESFLRSVRLVNDHAAYRGDKGDMIRWNEGRGKYVCGSFSPGSVWFECDTLPTVPLDGYQGGSWWWEEGESFKLAAMTFDPDTGEIVQAQGVADLALRFDHYGFGVEREEIWLGEVEEWR